MIFPLLAATGDPEASGPESAPDEPPRLTPAPAAPPPAPPAQPAPPDTPPPRPLAQRFALTLLLIAAAALIGYALSRPGSDARDPDVLVRSIEAMDRLQLVLDTADPLEARRFVRDEFGWRVGVPVFDGAAPPLRGVAVARVAPAVEVPVFLYAHAEKDDVVVFAYSYALFDQVPDRLRLARSDYDDLVGPDPVARRSDAHDVLLWRDRDDIYVAVTDVPPSLLAGGLTMVR